MAFLVVCGLSETIEIFCPSREFNSVDLPTFGRPITATKPDRNLLIASSPLGSPVLTRTRGDPHQDHIHLCENLFGQSPTSHINGAPPYSQDVPSVQST